MRIVFLLSFFVFSLSLPAQRFHRKVKSAPHHFYPAGTWLVVKEKHDPFPGRIVADTVRQTYYRFGDSLNWNLEIITFGRHTFDRTIIRNWQFSDSLGNVCWLDPQYFSWYGYYCPYEGDGADWKIRSISDSEMVFSETWSNDEYRFTDSLWLKKVSNVNSIEITDNTLPKGAWIADEFVCGSNDSISAVPFKYFRTPVINMEDSSFTQLWKWRNTYSTDTATHTRVVIKNYHLEKFEERLLLVSNDRKAYAWIDISDEHSCWIAFDSDCDSGILDGAFHYYRE